MEAVTEPPRSNSKSSNSRRQETKPDKGSLTDTRILHSSDEWTDRTPGQVDWYRAGWIKFG